MGDFWYKWKFGFALSGAMVAFELLILELILLGTPTGAQWLGDLPGNPSDYPVYLNYLAQGGHSILLKNLYNAGPQILRFDAFWSIGGLLVRFGFNPVWTHEILRWLCTILLGLAIYATAKFITQNERHAKLASFFMLSGLSVGWINAIWLKLFFNRDISLIVSPDLDKSFAIGPSLIGGAHIILSVTLQFIGIRFAWISIRTLNKKHLLIAWISYFTLTLFHPYYISLLGLVTLCALFWPKNSELIFKKRLIHFFILNTSLLIPLSYYLYLLQDAALREHQLVINKLPLEPTLLWVIALSPFIIAAAWLLIKKVPEQYKTHTHRSEWAWAWLISAVICMLLPFPWTDKYTQGLLPLLIIVTLPFWFFISDKLLKTSNFLIKSMLILACLLPYLYLFRFTFALISDPAWVETIYLPMPVINAWQYIKNNSPPDTVCTTRSLRANFWIPVYAERSVWLGHMHETPDYQNRLQDFKNWLYAKDPQSFQSYLDKNNITCLTSINSSESINLGSYLDHNWKRVFQEDGINVWLKTN